VLPI